MWQELQKPTGTDNFRIREFAFPDHFQSWISGLEYGKRESRDLGSNDWLMLFNIDKHKVLHFGFNNAKCDYRICWVIRFYR